MTGRLQEIAWIPHYRRDLESDFSVFHRVDHIDQQLTAAVFISRAERMYAYKGALRMRAEMEADRPSGPVQSRTDTAPARTVPDRQVMDLSALMVTAPGLIERVRA